jgi:hypothetical protein
MRRRKNLYATIKTRIGSVQAAPGQKLREVGRIHRAQPREQLENRFRLGGKNKSSMIGVVERLHAESVARKKKFSLRREPDRERPHSV